MPMPATPSRAARIADLPDAALAVIEGQPAGLDRLLSALDAPTQDEGEDSERWDEAFEGRN